MTPTQPLDLPAFHAKVARRVNLQLANKGKRGSVTSREVQRTLLGGWDYIRHADLIREIAEQLTAEMGGAT